MISIWKSSSQTYVGTVAYQGRSYTTQAETRRALWSSLRNRGIDFVRGAA